MQKHFISLTFAIVTATFLTGCGAPGVTTTGFLDDYAHLERQSDTSFRYIAPGNRLGDYHSFIIDPVIVYNHGDVPELSPEQIDELSTYLRDALINAISDQYPVVTSPGPGVARLRSAITDVKRSTWWMNLHLGMKATGAGTGSAAVEAEIIDSTTGERIGALVESQKGNQFELDTFSDLDDVKDVMDGWAKRLRKRLDEAHADH